MADLTPKERARLLLAQIEQIEGQLLNNPRSVLQAIITTIKAASQAERERICTLLCADPELYKLASGLIQALCGDRADRSVRRTDDRPKE